MKKNKKPPMRRCCGCMESKPKKELVRITCYEGAVSFDPTGKAKGRGVYLCPQPDCIAKARKKRALQRSFEAEMTEDTLQQVFSDVLAHVGDAV